MPSVHAKKLHKISTLVDFRAEFANHNAKKLHKISTLVDAAGIVNSLVPRSFIKFLLL